MGLPDFLGAGIGQKINEQDLARYEAWLAEQQAIRQGTGLKLLQPGEVVTLDQPAASAKPPETTVVTPPPAAPAL